MTQMFAKARHAFVVGAVTIPLLVLALPAAALAVAAVLLYAVALAIAHLAAGALMPAGVLIDVIAWARDGNGRPFRTVQRIARLVPHAATSAQGALALRDVLRLQAELLEINVREQVVIDVLHAMREADIDIEVDLHGIRVRRIKGEVDADAGGRRALAPKRIDETENARTAPGRIAQVLSWVATLGMAAVLVLDNPGLLTVCVAVVLASQEAILHAWKGIAETRAEAARLWESTAEKRAEIAHHWQANAKGWKAYAERRDSRGPEPR